MATNMNLPMATHSSTAPAASSSLLSKRPPTASASVFDVAMEAQLSNLFDLSSIMDTISLDISGSSSDIDAEGSSPGLGLGVGDATNPALRTPKKSDRSSSLDDSPVLSLPESFDDDIPLFTGRGVLSGSSNRGRDVNIDGQQRLKRDNGRNIRPFGSRIPYSSKLNVISEATYNALNQANRENLSPEELEALRYYYSYFNGC